MRTSFQLYHIRYQLNLNAPGAAIAFSPQAGGALHPRHVPLYPDAMPISHRVLLLLRTLQAQPPEVWQRLEVDAQTLSDAERATQAYLQHVLERRLRSAALLRRVSGG